MPTTNAVELIIITGLSGAGKSQAVKYFEDAGFFCMDNLPPALLPKFIQLCQDSLGKINKAAVVIDIRGGAFFSGFFEALDELHSQGVMFRILFLESVDEVLVRRFSETRRKHPLSTGGRIIEDIQFERKALAEVRERADLIINTSDMLARELYEEIRKIIEHSAEIRRMNVVLVSFGFKFGVPLDADLMFDVRFLPNPYYVPEMKNCTGLDQQVADYVLGSEVGTEFLARLTSFIEFLIPQFLQEPKTRVQVAIGCTGGRHRSVTLVEALARNIKHDRVTITRRHRDLELK
jgi:RNase adapter protein RapZ